MNYECKCTPTQEHPHVVKSPHVKNYWKRPLAKYLSIQRRLHPAKSCDGHPVPKKEWELGVFGKYVEFGKIVY